MSENERAAVRQAVSWVEANQTVRERAQGNLGFTDEEIGDAVLDDPERLVHMFEQLGQQAQAENAPEEVVTTLYRLLEKLRGGITNLQPYEYTLSKFQDMKGLRDVKEFDAVLTEAAAQAPDEANRQRLEHARAAVNAVGTQDPTTEESCPFCCAMGCSVCGVNCSACCIVGCVGCEIMEP